MTEQPPSRPPRPGLSARFSALGAAERLATIGAVTLLASLLLPWYGLKLIEHVSQTGLDAFSWGQAALVLTALAALAVVSAAAGRRLPRPLAPGPLLVVCGTWAAALVGYLMIDRPDAFDPLVVTLRYGIFVALAGAIALIVAGARMARERRD